LLLFVLKETGVFQPQDKKLQHFLSPMVKKWAFFTLGLRSGLNGYPTVNTGVYMGGNNRHPIGQYYFWKLMALVKRRYRRQFVNSNVLFLSGEEGKIQGSCRFNWFKLLRKEERKPAIKVFQTAIMVLLFF